MRGHYDRPDLRRFVTNLLAKEDAVLRSIRVETPRFGIPPISIGPDEGRLLDLLVRSCQAKRAVEIGTLAGYSGTWIARALRRGGVLHTLEADSHHASVARRNFRRAGLAKTVRVHEGPAAKTLKSLGKEPFDFCFIDADKVNYPLYLRWAVSHVRPGGLVVGDNAYFFGKLHLNAKRAGQDARGAAAMRRFLKGMADRRYFSSAAMIPTGEGMAVAVRK